MLYENGERVYTHFGFMFGVQFWGSRLFRDPLLHSEQALSTLDSERLGFSPQSPNNMPGASQISDTEVSQN